MLSGTFAPPKRRRPGDINIVPILDMLTTIIFFLLLSTSFLEYNKVTVPPSGTVTVTTPASPPPLDPKMAIVRTPLGFEVRLRWVGAEAGAAGKTVPADDDVEKNLQTVVEALASDFKTKYPAERTLQLGLGRDVPYQNLITAMDALRPQLPDIVLISYADAESLAVGKGAE